MQRAKHTVESEYSVVGSFDGDLTNITLQVLEHYIPRFFKDAFKVYHCKLTVNNSQDLSENQTSLQPKKMFSAKWTKTPSAQR